MKDELGQSEAVLEVPRFAPNFERYQRIARLYDILDAPFEYGRYRRIRPLLFNGLSGRILEAGIGTGRNVRFYPQDAWVVGIDLSPAMLARATLRVKASPCPVALINMDVTRLSFPDSCFDGAVATFLFCVLPEQLQVLALSELGRVVKTGGTIRLLEYVRPRRIIRRLIAKLWEPWIAWAYGASFDHQTEAHVAGAGLDLVDTRFVIDDLVKLISLRVPRARLA
ncbi:MAG: class I SAM-dependent methyltransferase [Acetobacteraceae bacterium]|nr:class I SAM-dependent methyltransferase [Acetobacteraceae bacterium]